ncbi:MAG TPA: hypothetical protein VMT91_07775, partial [Anaerolineales bacterium]|nr:hypothetical protein [Anaerolineales bacterium]
PNLKKRQACLLSSYPCLSLLNLRIRFYETVKVRINKTFSGIKLKDLTMDKTRSNDFSRSLPRNERLKPSLQVSRQHKMLIQNWRYLKVCVLVASWYLLPRNSTCVIAKAGAFPA